MTEEKENFSKNNREIVDYSKLRVGLKQLEDAVYELNEFKRINPRYGDKKFVLDAINSCRYDTLRDISNFFFKTSGIYKRLCKYMAYLYKYDYIVTPYIGTEKKKENIIKTFNQVLSFLDEFNVKKIFGEIALKVMRYGCYYCYILRDNKKIAIQELPIKYCRSRFRDGEGNPVVEFDMRFFDQEFSSEAKRKKMLKLFPKDFRKGYAALKAKKLEDDYWYTLEVGNVFKFNLDGEDAPPFMSIIPAIIDLDDAKGIDKKRMMQRILKLLIQKLPLDKNGDPIFDIEEAKEFHRNAVAMLSKTIGLDVLTTYAEVDVEDLDNDSSSSTSDELEKVERAVYNEAGVSQMQFNTDGNIALEKSILNDEASLGNLIAQFEDFLNLLIKDFNKKPQRVEYKVQMLLTTIYNYKEMSKLYLDQTKVGYSKMLPPIALGQKQRSVLANNYFENEILDLSALFIPPMSSNTMNAEGLADLRGKNKSSEDPFAEDKQQGRPKKSDDEKAEKTIMNEESSS